MDTRTLPPPPAPAPRIAGAESAAAGDEHAFSLELHLDSGYAQIVEFDHEQLAPIVVDEPPPLGANSGPNPARLLAAAVGSCLGASLLFCARKSKIDVRGLRTRVTGTMVRNERGRLRIGELRVTLAPELRDSDAARLGRCQELFEDFCIVTQSIRGGVNVVVDVQPASRA